MAGPGADFFGLDDTVCLVLVGDWWGVVDAAADGAVFFVAETSDTFVPLLVARVVALGASVPTLV